MSSTVKRLLVVGGVAGGATAAARARRVSEHAKITVIERGAEVSFANCGLPYHVGGEIAVRSALIIQPKETLAARFALDIRTNTEVLRIDRERKELFLQDLSTGKRYKEEYDALILAPGGQPIVPGLPGIDSSHVYTLRNLDDMDRIKARVDQGARSALVVGGGFIGLELAENLRRRGLSVILVELLPQVMGIFDSEMAAPLGDELRNNGVDLRLSDALVELRHSNGGVDAVLSNSANCQVDMVILAVGVKPESKLAAEAGLALNQRGAIIVDERMRTSDPSIYAVGDAVEVTSRVLSAPVMVPLAGPANRQARIAVDNIFGLDARYRGALGTSIVRVFGLSAAAVGPSEKALKSAGLSYKKVYVVRGQHVGYFPGAQQMVIKLLFAENTGQVLGAQIIGGDGVDKRIDLCAVAIYGGMTVYDLQDLELAYAPQFGAAKDPLNIAGYVAVNALEGREDYLYPTDLDEEGLAAWTVLDVREAAEHKVDHISGSILIPLGELRQRTSEIPKDRPVAVYCGVGQRAYYASRILRDRGYVVKNIAGGLTVWRMVHRRQ